MSNADSVPAEKPAAVHAARMAPSHASYPRANYPLAAYGNMTGHGRFATSYPGTQLGDAFAGLSVSGQGSLAAGAGIKLAPNNLDVNGLPRAAAYGNTPLMVLPSGQTIPLPSIYGHGHAPGTDQQPSMPYVPTGMFPNFVSSTNMAPGSMPAYGWPYGLQNDVPSLDADRRGSWSSNDENGPTTPGMGTNGHQDYYANVAGLDRGSMISFPYATPSPPAVIQPYVAGPMQPMKCPDNKNYESVNLDGLTQQPPAIPRAVPALWTNQEDLSLAKCLQNPEGITNIYIRGFLPDVTDQDIHDYAARFGEIESCKAIVDMDSGNCKGFGFVKYYSPASAENCIRGFFHLGYQASYAQKSRNSRLKDLEDRTSANIYCTAVPIKWNEADLANHFKPYHAISTKICREADTGICKEVGFARFENRDLAEQIIKDFHNVTNEVDGVKLCLRFADTKAQKQLKQTSQEKRNWRAHEYKYSVEHTPSPTIGRMQQVGSHVSPASHVSYHSPAGGSTSFTPATSVSPTEVTGPNKVGGNNKQNSWPTQGGLPSVNSTPIYHPPHRVNTARNAFTDQLPPKTNMQIVHPAETPDRSKTPSPQKVAVKIENVSPAHGNKENAMPIAHLTV